MTTTRVWTDRRARGQLPGWFACFVVLGLAFCGQAGPGPVDASIPARSPAAGPSKPVPQVVLPGEVVIEVEIASSDVLRAQGLMFRESLQPGHGMLFLFREADVHLFWMKNTVIPLDMIWLDEERIVVHIESDVPPCTGDPCPNYGPEEPTHSVLEIGGGEAVRNGLEIGDRLEFRNLEGVIIR